MALEERKKRWYTAKHPPEVTLKGTGFALWVLRLPK
jgi:hypothetical protein